MIHYTDKSNVQLMVDELSKGIGRWSVHAALIHICGGYDASVMGIDIPKALFCRAYKHPRKVFEAIIGNIRINMKYVCYIHDATMFKTETNKGLHKCSDPVIKINDISETFENYLSYKPEPMGPKVLKFTLGPVEFNKEDVHFNAILIVGQDSFGEYYPLSIKDFMTEVGCPGKTYIIDYELEG